MAYKPCRGNRITLDKAIADSQKYKRLVIGMITDNSYLSFKNLNYFSKCVFLHYKSDMKKGISSASLEYSAVFCHILDMFKRHPTKIYKPLAKHLKLI